jgi:phospholipid/cholesterol/gamma-HCH transport system substrate-binding protein
VIGRRVRLNLAMFLGVSAVLILLGAGLVVQPGGGRTMTLDFTDAAGLAPRNDVTMRGVPVGTVSTVTLLPNGVARVAVRLQRGVTVPAGTSAQITRRSPIGDLTLDLTPGAGAALPDGAHIPESQTSSPPDAEKTIEDLARILGAVPSQQLGQLVSTLATALQGRGQDLATLSEASAQLPERLLQVQAALRSLIENGPKVTGVLAANAPQLADDITQTAALADILRDRRYDLLALMQNGARFTTVAGGLLHQEKANISCLVADLGTLNATIAQPGNLSDLEGALQYNHYFFDAVWLSVQTGLDSMSWFRVHVLPPQQPGGRSYVPPRPAPDVFPGNACRSPFGQGVGPVTQPGAYLAPGSRLHPGQ